jgi:hypothetical protein
MKIDFAMMRKQPLTALFFIALFIYSCGEVNQNTGQESETTETETYDSEPSYEVEEEEQEEEQGFVDGTHTATVYYTNSETGHSATYTLEVEVEGNEVTILYFDSGGYLDSDHIQPAELDESGNATIYGEGGKTYEVQIDK